jgi:hypothetical protein
MEQIQNDPKVIEVYLGSSEEEKVKGLKLVKKG